MSSTDAKRSQPGELIRGFLAYLGVEKGYSDATVRAYQTDLEQFQQFLKGKKRSVEKPGRLTLEHIRGFLAEMHRRQLSKTSIGRKLSSLRAFLSTFCAIRLLSKIRQRVSVIPSRKSDILNYSTWIRPCP